MGHRFVSVFLILLAIPLAIRSETGVHPEIWFAHSVAVMGYDGKDIGSIYDSKISLEERKIISDLEDRFRKWGRYHVVTRVDDADIVVVIKKGSRMSVGIGGGQRFPGGGPIPGLDLAGDFFGVYKGHEWDGIPLWKNSDKDGLKGPQYRTFEKFKRQVEEAEKPPKP
jgi:hypothetical protein